MFTTIAYSEEQDTGGNLAYVAAVPDQHVRVEGDNIVVPSGMGYLLGVFASGVSITRARIESPSLRRTLLLDVPMLRRGGVTSSTPHALNEFFYNPLPLEEFEILRALVAEDESGPERETVLVWIGDGPQSPVTGEIYTVEASANETLTPYEWSSVSINMVQTLPAGRYQLVGLQAMSSGLIAARVIFVGLSWRPGCIGVSGYGRWTHSLFRRGALGVWGEFTHDQPPVIEFLSSSADTTEYVWLDLIKVG